MGKNYSLRFITPFTPSMGVTHFLAMSYLVGSRSPPVWQAGCF